MLLKDLSDYYDQLLENHPNDVAQPGWSSCNVKGFLEIDQDGRLRSIVPVAEKRGQNLKVPEQAKKSSGIKANFLCDAAPYFLGIPTSKKPGDDANPEDKAKYTKEADRARRCFEASRKLHHEILDNVDSSAAHAILSYYDSWDISEADADPVVLSQADALTAGGFFAFSIASEDDVSIAVDDTDVKAAWNRHYAQQDDDDIASMLCLVTGKVVPVARLHPSIKGVMGAQSSGATLVSFNDRSSESYGHVEEQGRNAPVSKRVAQAYGTSLNYLLSDKTHHARLGDTTIVYWSGRNDRNNTEFMSVMAFGNDMFVDTESADEAKEQAQLDGTIQRLVRGKPVGESGLDFESPFHVIGLAPNASRLSVRFMLQDSFGAIVENIAEHYRCLEIVTPKGARPFLSPFALLKAVENPHSKKPVFSSPLVAPLMRAILNGEKYPMGLYQAALLRIKATQDDSDKGVRKVNRVRTAIIKACLIRNFGRSKEEITVKLNEERVDTAYNLGRAFCLLESIQWHANDGETNIAARFMNTASSTPAIVFPTLLRLANAHLKKISTSKKGLAVNLKKGLTEILGESRVPAFPQRFTLDEQGDFFLGYYHQLASRFEKNDTSDDMSNVDVSITTDTLNEEE
ncbi:type I-C CRISPR-associated protein Cas8c/Csd1 [Cryptobacterium curtum]|uniref:type I-C CRISPR-associated protein Cas8c/Csd1 n=1 Tax=Cryptobacterium curtum TaxID=84163 RepID=UPI00248ED7D7|nr:type I-C CRISPR-associated protein Cas8c/Csd1 [Cryptobacterium curtum]